MRHCCRRAPPVLPLGCRRVRFNKNLPTPEVLAAWFGRYGRHVRQLHLRHLDAGRRALAAMCSVTLCIVNT